MIRALAIKELREIGWIVAIGFAAYMVVVGAIVSTTVETGLVNLPGLQWFIWQVLQLDYYRSLPFVRGEYEGAFVMISLVLAVTLGFRQTVGESLGGTFNFLLHRPLLRRTLFLTKLGVGFGLLWLASAVPILLLAWWAATPGSHPSPFEWSMTYPIWKMWAAMPLVYLGAFLSGIRPASWWGTRLIPLVAIAVPAVVVSIAPLWLISALLTVVSVLLLAITILWVGQTRDFS